MALWRGHIPLAVKREIWALPCAICGLSGLTVVDHINPIATGGTADRSNLQPLCVQCNAKKKHLRTNGELRAWFNSRRPSHICWHYYRLFARFQNPYDGLNFNHWLIRWLGGQI